MATQGPPHTPGDEPHRLAAGRVLDPLVVDAHVTMESNDPRPAFDRRPVPLWIAIRNRRIDFNTYARFIHQAFTRTDDPSQIGQPPPIAARLTSVMGTMRTSPPGRTDCLQHGWLGHGINAYELLKTATEIFLLLECGVFITSYLDPAPPSIPGAEDARVKGKPTLDALRAALADTLGGNRLPYINQIVSSVLGPRAALDDLPFADGVLRARVECPCFLELMWSYWLEEGMLVQGLNALSMRFQNRRTASGRDPLAQLELSPLRPLSSIFWGYVQDEQHRLSLARRNFEYEHEYGLSLRGKAVPAARAADRRSKFIEGFHDLLYRSAVYYQQSANLQFNPDPFPLLNGLKEVHLVLSQGAGNQFGDLPWTARVEMLMQQWILARPEIREFLGRRPMVAYDEDWMANADALKTAMGWTDTSIVHFRNLAVYGEQLLLSIRWHAWSSESDASTARDWANYWRPEIQSYLHAYRIATGVDLSTEPRDGAASKHVQAPSLLLEARMGEQRRNGGAP